LFPLLLTEYCPINQVNNHSKYSLLDTNEREDLCELLNNIADKSGLNLKNYRGEDITEKWRDW
jgi:hypothetical protein